MKCRRHEVRCTPEWAGSHLTSITRLENDERLRIWQRKRTELKMIEWGKQRKDDE